MQRSVLWLLCHLVNVRSSFPSLFAWVNNIEWTDLSSHKPPVLLDISTPAKTDEKTNMSSAWSDIQVRHLFFTVVNRVLLLIPHIFIAVSSHSPSAMS